jgi:hypothetical protein
MAAVPHAPYFPLIPRLKIKLKDRNFDTIEVTEAESRMHLKMAEALGTVHTRGKGWWPVGPKLVLPDGSTTPGNYG